MAMNTSRSEDPIDSPDVSQPAAPTPVKPTFDQINADYQKYLGRGASQDEYNQFWANKADYNPTDIVGSKEGLTYATTPHPAAATAGATGGAGSTAAAGSAESMIDALYKQYGISDGGRQSGFADRAYWLEHPSEILNGRLGRDLAGTGDDQPTGTPGAGPWSSSGQRDRDHPGGTIGGGSSIGNTGSQFWWQRSGPIGNPQWNPPTWNAPKSTDIQYDQAQPGQGALKDLLDKLSAKNKV